jgi:5-methylcytosine-specific restriction protein A
MSRPPRLTVCSKPDCHLLTRGSRCDEHERAADQARGTAAQRGYGGKAWRFARRNTLRRDPVCVVCHTAPATVADHYPVSRKDLVALGVTDPDAPARLRGLCAGCHGRSTAEDQPGGWNLDR